MNVGRIEADSGAVDEVARSCGSLAVACTTAAGQIGNVSESLIEQLTTLSELETVTKALESEQRGIAAATADARTLSAQAREKLHAGGLSIREVMAEFEAVTTLVTRLGEQLTGFAAAMHQVRRVTEGIDAIARTTNMLALNAAIEAERAGVAGRSFAVVAAEVKALAGHTRSAVEEVGSVIKSLDREAGSIAAEVASGVEQSRAVRGRFAEVNQSVADVSQMVGLVEQQSNEVARGAAQVLDSVLRVRDELGGFGRAARDNGRLLAATRSEMTDLETLSNRMFDRLVHSGFSHNDARFVEYAMRGAAQVTAVVERALRSGAVTPEDVFDTDYRLIPGSNPPRYDNRFVDFADEAIRPILDSFCTLDPLIFGAVCTDVNGYLPTHETDVSKPMRPDDPVYNETHCRNRRISMDPATARAVQSEEAFQMAVYRVDTLGERTVLKNVFVPLRFDGRRWGNFEVGYL